ncbi:MAG: hypothetical protein NVS2B12_06090 [Ktedonobacteraceae bacterium]
MSQQCDGFLLLQGFSFSQDFQAKFRRRAKVIFMYKLVSDLQNLPHLHAHTFIAELRIDVGGVRDALDFKAAQMTTTFQPTRSEEAVECLE